MRILLVRLRLIGDVVFTTPLIAALRRRFPAAHLAYLVEPLAAPVVEHHPALDRVHVAAAPRAPERFRADLRLAAALRRERFDVAIDLHGGPRAAWLAWATGAPRRIGYAIAGRRWMYTETVARARDLPARHAVRNQWDLLTPLGVPPPDPARDPLAIAESPEAAARVTARLEALGVRAEHTLAVLHVSAGNRFRRWPPDAFAAVAARLAATPDRRVVVISGPSDAPAATRIADAACARLGADGAGRVVPAAFDVAEIRALAGRASVYIGGDSGPLHIAGATPTPIVALFGPTLPGRSMPWRDPRWYTEAVDAGPLPCRPCDQRVCAPGDFRCLTGIGVDAVAEAAERALASRKALTQARSTHA